VAPTGDQGIAGDLQQFHVADDRGRVVGCCSLAVQWDNLAEVKALAVNPDFQ
jgi:amino-acid N-acetyltransferase